MHKSIHSKVVGIVILMIGFKFAYTRDKNPPSMYKHTFYAYFDIVREYGVGYQYQAKKWLSFDVSVFGLYQGGALKNVIQQWDYNHFKGYGLKVTPKFKLKKLNYIAPFFTVENLFYKRGMIQEYNDPVIMYYLRDAKGYGFSYGVSYGYRFNISQLMLETYLAMGITDARLDYKEYGFQEGYLNGFNSNKTFYKHDTPFSYSEHKYYFYTNIGIKIGFNHKKLEN